MSTTQRLQNVYRWMHEQGIALVMLSDFETSRDPAIRYLTGHPADALLFLHESARSLLVPWDSALARLHATADAVIPYTDFKLEAAAAARAALEHFALAPGARVELPDSTTYPVYQKYAQELPGCTLVCRKEGAGDFIRSLRAVKDADEINLIRTAAAITDELIAAIVEGVGAGALATEADVALFIERECRARGCEGASFATLAAGPARSFAIHAFPGWTGAPFATRGLSILDFGVNYQGYASDVTLTFARGKLSGAQERQLSLVMDAFNMVIDLLNAELTMSARRPALAVDDFFAKAGLSMPHGLGHGIGLEIHEAPFLRSRESNTDCLAAGMVFTVEPGLYAPETGGARYENDILLTPRGAEILTHSQIVRLP